LAKRNPQMQFRSLAHLIDEAALGRAFARLRKDAAAGVDELTKEEYGRDLETRLRDLHERLRARRYRHQPIRRVHIRKESGGTRPIGISTVEDKIVQAAITEVLEAVYEQDFLDGSYGFRPGRSAHDALRSLNRIVWTGQASWILEADIESFFDSIDRSKLIEILRLRVVDGALLRLIGKCLRVGVLDGANYTESETGTAQGSVLSPLLGNIYLHHVLDLWFEHEVRPRLRGRATLVRYADDFVIGFEHEADARRVLAVVGKRMQRFGLRLHPDKTRLIPFGKPPTDHTGGKGPATFDFLGFTLHWRRSRRGGWALGFKTRKGRIARAVRRLNVWCRRHRHLPIDVQHAALRRQLNGHYSYFGVSGNYRSLNRFFLQVHVIWLKWLRRRSQRTVLTVDRYRALLETYPLPQPTIRVRLWLPTS
jgi:group II intron reverse transcriptase/maturase